MQEYLNHFSEYLQKFTSIPEESIKALVGLFKPITMKKNEFYARDGERAKKLAFIGSGLMRAYYVSYKGEEFNKLFFKPPAIVGAYSSLITGEINKINIQCLTDCELFETNFQAILDLYEEHPMIERLNRVIAEDFFVKKEKREMSLVMHNAAERYALFQEEFPDMENQVAQYHIASYLGITATQLSRIRAKKK